MATFIDTSFLIALVIQNDALHERAIAWRNYLRGPWLTSEFVLLEAADSLSKPTRRSFARDIVRDVREDQSIEIVALETAWRDRGITDALTHDRRFEQAGFRALLRTDPPGN